MKHRSLDRYVTLYNVCKQGGKEMYYYVDTQPERRLQDKNLKEFFKQIEEHGYDVISPSDKDYEQIVKAYNVVSKRDAVKDDMSSYTHYKPEAICKCGRWLFMDRMAYYDEKQLVEIDYSRISSKNKPQQTEKVKEMMSSIRVPAFQKQSVKRFLNFLKDTQSSDASIPAALREAIYTLESKVEKHSDSSAMDSYIEGIKKDIEILKKLEDLLPRL